MARHCHIGLIRSSESVWELDNAKGFFDNWNLIFVNRAPKARKQIRANRRNIKKLSELQDQGYDIWAIDEVHFQQQGTRCRMWIAPENIALFVIQQPTRKGVGYFGAVRIRDGKFIFSREEKVFDAVSTWNFLKKVRKFACHSGRKVALIIDNAKYHHAILHRKWREKAGDKFLMAYLPPYSPELNPIERVWKFTRRMRLHNQFFPTLHSLIYEAENLFKLWHFGSDDLKRLCSIG